MKGTVGSLGLPWVSRVPWVPWVSWVPWGLFGLIGITFAIALPAAWTEWVFSLVYMDGLSQTPSSLKR